MKIGVIHILGMEEGLIKVLVEHFHNATDLIHIDQTIDPTYNLVIVPPSTLYSESEELRRRIGKSKLYENLREYAKAGGYIVGIQSGFQLLCAANLLEGQFARTGRTPLTNQLVYLKPEFKRSALTYLVDFDTPIKLYLSHSMGSYKLKEELVHNLQLKGQILMRYCDNNGAITKESNPDGSASNIAALCNESRNIYGITANPAIKAYYTQKLDGLELMDSFFKMITR